MIKPGAFRDPESQVTKIDYRVVDASSDSLVYLPWNTIPIQQEIRVGLSPIAVPRTLLPFDGALPVAVEFRATNGSGLSNIKQSIIEVPGDITPPEAPALNVYHRNAYDPRHPNTLEINVGPSIDEQSTITQAQYRVINESSNEDLVNWTTLPISYDGTFPGKVIFVDLPFLSSNSEMRVEVEIINSAQLVRKRTENVTILIERDDTPPSLNISLYHFSGEATIVL